MDFSAVIETIGMPLIQEVISLWGLTDQVERLERELKWMQSFLKDADATKVADSELVHTYVADVRELAYEAEDVIETFALKVASNKKLGGIPSFVKRSACCLKEGWLRYKTKLKIEKITAKIEEFMGLLQKYDVRRLRDEGAPSSSSTDQRRESRRPYPHIIDDNIVGLDADIKKVVSILVDKEHHDRRVVSICGMGGLGKTTLAKRVYNHSQIRSHFNHLAWVYVSQQYQKRKVWEVILSGLNLLEKEDRKKTDEELAKKLSEILKEKKCLVILDDIWKAEAWDSIKPAFPTRDTSSKILLTSRNKKIVSHADRRGYLYELQFLEEKESWELFQKVAFPMGDSSTTTEKTVRIDSCMEELGKEMIKHCGGLPLAIVVLGGILATKFSLNEWKKISENVLTYLKRDKGHGIEHVLDLSYDDLPPYLRPCFLYLSHFPEDYKIGVDRLIQLWIAEGFVSIKHDEGNGLGETLEDVAECYLIELAGRYMIQVEERDVIGKIKTCRMHDVIRETCLSKAKQEKLFHIIDHSNSSSPLSKVPRVAAHESFLVQGIKNPHLRSLIFFHEFFPQDVIEGYSLPQKLVDYVNKDPDERESNRVIILAVMLAILCMVHPKIRATWTYMLDNFKLLRVLDFENYNFGGCKLPDDLGNLIHLRFLCLGHFSFFFSKLPSCLGNLRCLQTLDLRGMQGVRLTGDGFEGPIHVPNVIWKLIQLRHLYLPECLKRKTRLRLDTLVKLQTLVNFNMRNCYVADLVKLINLRDLKIVWLSSAHEAFEKHLNNNPHIITSKYLRSLSFNHNIHIVFTKEFGKMDPTHMMQFFSNCVDIYELSISWVAMSKLPHYHHFPLEMAYVSLHGTLLHEDPMPTLEKLPNLRILKFNSAAFIGNKMVCSAQGFPRLDSLTFDGLSSLEEWKMDGGAMLALRHFEISYCRQLKMLPEGLRFIATLQELKITFMPNTFLGKLVQGGEDFHKVQHIPSIVFISDDDILDE